MKYDWEDAAVKKLLPKIIELNDTLDGKFSVWGFAIENEEVGEACFVKVCQVTGDIFDVAVSSDVAADTQDLHVVEIEMLREISALKRKH